jgi:sec-independent protein translocase protein TatC
MADADALRGAGVPGRIPSPIPGPSDPGPETADDRTVMSLVDHLTELRSRLVRTILAIAVGAALGFVASERVIAVLRAALPTEGPLQVLGVGDAFSIRLRIAIVIGIILAMPVILYQIWAFVAPGLTDLERRAVRPWIPLALLFFVMGVGIAWLVLPFAAAFLLGFQTPDLETNLVATNYFDFVSTMFLVFGLVMEFPILIFGLARVGILTSDRLRASRRMVVLAIAVFSAAATPGGDLVSPLALGGTMYVLYELTILAVRRSGR